MSQRLLLQYLGLLWVCQQCLAQGGYNYGRPAEENVANVGAQTTSNPLRSIVPGFSTTAASAVNAYPTATAAYGVGSTGTGIGGFAGQAQRASGGTIAAGGFTPVPSAGFTGGAGGLLPRPTLPQRTPGGIFGAGQTQFATSTGRGAAVQQGASIDDQEGDYSAIPGAPGVDYPIYSQVPPTNFDCAQQQLPGYYADVEALCQVFHICALNRTYSFLCPNGTIFSQETLVCVWWNQYNCAAAPSLYANNAFIYDYGQERVPSNAGYQLTANQIGIGSASSAARQQTNAQLSNQGRATAAPSGIFGAGALRSSSGGNNYAGVAGLVGSSTAGVRYTPNPSAVAGNLVGGQTTFPISPTAAATPAAFGAVLRAGGAVGGGGGNTGGGLQDAAYGNAQLAASTSNREYLPPRRP